jgi:hypothetical protein
MAFAFYVGLHQPSDCRHFARAFVSVHRLAQRQSAFSVAHWILDSGAFSEIASYGRYRDEPAVYVAQIERWRHVGTLDAAVSQDWMCEPWMLQKTGLTVAEHQARTIERYRQIAALTSCYIMPVLQGYAVGDYLAHVQAYGAILQPGQWCGVGSLCKRNGHVASIEAILLAIKHIRPDLRLHGFGLKLTALASVTVRDCLHSADSMAWSYSARKQGRNGNDWREAARFVRAVETQPQQLSLSWGA